MVDANSRWYGESSWSGSQVGSIVPRVAGRSRRTAAMPSRATHHADFRGRPCPHGAIDPEVRHGPCRPADATTAMSPLTTAAAARIFGASRSGRSEASAKRARHTAGDIMKRNLRTSQAIESHPGRTAPRMVMITTGSTWDGKATPGVRTIGPLPHRGQRPGPRSGPARPVRPARAGQVASCRCRAARAVPLGAQAEHSQVQGRQSRGAAGSPPDLTGAGAVRGRTKTLQHAIPALTRSVS